MVSLEPTEVERLANLAANAEWDDISRAAADALRVRVLDAVGCAIGALGSGPPSFVRDHVVEFGGTPSCTLIGGGRSAPDRAALLNGILVRYLDFNDSYLAPGETCHPSDNLAAVLAAAEYARASGRDLLVALAVAYQIQCRLSEVAPVRHRGFDHTVQLAYGAAAGVARALGLDAGPTANAVAIAGTTLNALRVTRTGALSHWKGMVAPFTAAGALDVAFLAGRGLTGPREVIEGVKGFQDAIAGPFTVDWAGEDGGLDLVTRTALKRYNAEVHSQTAIDTALALCRGHGITGSDVAGVHIETFQVAYDIIGGGEEGDKRLVRTKEEADHSLPYLVAVALLDGEVLPAQFEPGRIAADDVQSLLRRVAISPAPDLTLRFPVEQPCRMTIRLHDGRELTREQADYEGWPTRPMTWGQVAQKFGLLATPRTSAGLRSELTDAIAALDRIDVADLTVLLSGVSSPEVTHADRR
jgi:2-methylcitrate dehydratase